LGIETEYEIERTHWAIKDYNLIKTLREKGVIELKQDLPKIEHSQIIIKPKEFSLPRNEIDPTLISVMMPFKKEFDPVYKTINEVCQNIGFKCQRVDDIWHESTIIQDIFNLIFSSVIVDLSGQNPNVLYETGIAHTLGKPVIPIARDIEKQPFDLKHHRILKYLNNKLGLKEMKGKIKKRLLTLAN
jgi:hypothetical protein